MLWSIQLSTSLKLSSLIPVQLFSLYPPCRVLWFSVGVPYFSSSFHPSLANSFPSRATSSLCPALRRASLGPWALILSVVWEEGREEGGDFIPWLGSNVIIHCEWPQRQTAAASGGLQNPCPLSRRWKWRGGIKTQFKGKINCCLS